MRGHNYSYQCFFVDRFNWLRYGFIDLNAAVLGWREKGAQGPVPEIGPQRKVALEGVPGGSSEQAVEKAVRNAAENATDFSWLNKGDRVLVKPACNSAQKYPATTSPAGIRAMVKLLKDKGAGKVMVSDMAGIEHVRLTPDTLCGSTRECMKKNGMAQAAESAGAELFFPEESGWDAFFEDGPVSGSHWKNGIYLPKILKEIEHVVLMPRLSRHPLGGATLGLKAAVGYIRFDSRLEYHRDASSFFEKHTEINSTPSLQDRLRLTLSVATKAQTTFGPDEGFALEPELGLVFGSESIVAHDLIAMAWLNHCRESTPESEKTGMRDPYSTNTSVISILNGGLVFLLGGIAEAIKTETLKKFDTDNIYNDPTLHRAFEIWGGAPSIELTDGYGTVPEDIKKDLQKRIVL